ncbi:MAG: peptidoglycan recognition family protein [Myxococcota bacterium]
MALSLPRDAREELELAGGVVLYDVSTALPRKQHPRGMDRRPKDAKIERAYVHHSGALGRGGFPGALSATEFVMGKKKSPFPGAPYHFWLPYRDERDHTGRLVVLRLAEDEYRAWHTGGDANHHGIGVALQGNLSKTGPSASQIEGLEALLPWLIQRHGLVMPLGISWHAEGDRFGGRSKSSCPGKPTVAWLEDYRERVVAPDPLKSAA